MADKLKTWNAKAVHSQAEERGMRSAAEVPCTRSASRADRIYMQDLLKYEKKK